MPILIYMLGLYLTGQLFNDVIKDSLLKQYPLILESTCIMSFKGNIEVVFAIKCAMMKDEFNSLGEYLTIIMRKTNDLILESFLVGVFVGFIGVVFNSLDQDSLPETNLKIVLTCALSCVLTSLIFCIALILVIEVSTKFKWEEETFLAPSFSALIDYLNVKILILFTKAFHDFSLGSMVWIGISLLILASFNFFIGLKAPRFTFSLPASALFVSLAGSVLAGFLIQKLSARFTFLAATYPFFGGVSVSTSLIYLHTVVKKTNIYQKGQLINTLLFLSMTTAIVFILLDETVLEVSDFAFPIAFIVFFMIQTLFLIIILNQLIEWKDNSILNNEFHALPFITGISDILSVVLLLIAAVAASSV